MVMAAELSLLIGQLKKNEVSRVRDLLKRAGLPVAGPALAPRAADGPDGARQEGGEGQDARFVLLEGDRTRGAARATSMTPRQCARPLSLQRSNCIFSSSVMSLPGPRAVPPFQRARRLRRRLRRAHQGQEVAHHRRAGPHGAAQPHPPRRGGLGPEALRRRRAADPDPRPLLARGDGEAGREAAARRPVRRRHGVPAARPGIAHRLRVRDRARHQGRGPGAARLARCAGRQQRPRRAGEEARAGDPPGVHRARPAASRSPMRSSASSTSSARAPATRSRRCSLKHGKEFYVPSMSARTRLLQGHAARLPGRRVLPRPEGCARRVGARAGAPALLDQHLPVLGPRAPVPHDLPQRRDQHAARQRQLDPRAPGRDLLARSWARTWPRSGR